MRQLTGHDASFLYVETPTTPSMGAGLGIYDPSTAPGGFVRFKDILAAYESRLHLATYLRSRIVRVPMDLDHPYWVDDPDFDLEFHVRHIALPKPGDWRQLCIQVARLLARPLDLARPPWEIYVIEGLDNVEGVPPGAFAIFNKVHHAAVDGAAGTEIFNAMHDTTPEVSPEPPPEEWSPEPTPTEWELLARAQLNHALIPMRMAELMSRSAPTFAASPFDSPPTVNTPPPVTRFNGPVTAHRVVEGRRLPLAGLRQARTVVPGATVNDALLAVVGGAIREYLKSKDDLPPESLVAMAPVSVRGPDSEMGGNEVAAMFVGIGTHLADPVERLAKVKSETSEQKVILEAIGARNLVAYAEFLPGAWIGASQRLATELGVANQRQPIYNTVVTNLPGSQEPLYFRGSRLVEYWGFGIPTENSGLMHAAQSYCGTVYLTAISCPKMLPDPEFYAECLQASFDELVRASGDTPPRTRAKPAKAAAAKKAATKTTTKPTTKPTTKRSGTATSSRSRSRPTEPRA